jgi:hypothetical protein
VTFCITGSALANLRQDSGARCHGLAEKLLQPASTRYTKQQLGGGRVEGQNNGPRNQMLDEERQEVEKNPGPDNHEPWAGSQQPK